MMKVADFLDRFGIGRTTFYREVGQGRLRVVKIGRATRVTRTDASAWLDKLRDQENGSVISVRKGEST